LIAPLMTCSARIPVYTLIISAFIPEKEVWGWINLRGLVMFGLYAAGIASALGLSFLVKFFMWRDYQPAPFMLELPDYKMPRVRSIAIGILNRAKMFLKRAEQQAASLMRSKREPSEPASLASRRVHLREHIHHLFTKLAAVHGGIKVHQGAVEREHARFPSAPRATRPSG